MQKVITNTKKIMSSILGYKWFISMSNVTKVAYKKLKWVKDISKFGESFKKSYNEKSDKRFFLEVYVQYPKNLHDFDFHFLPEKRKTEKVEKYVVNLHDKTEYVIHIRISKPAY